MTCCSSLGFGFVVAEAACCELRELDVECRGNGGYVASCPHLANFLPYRRTSYPRVKAKKMNLDLEKLTLMIKV